ncbi:hypothetical protein LWI29_012172 [Acer saccharum]|uniref:RNase H type-1 domain-containing protein n=1 Tax=Acer saccharum TaxID=4024 RepID=A0AA39S3I7_ACESA|nr:hypothetical protein LWI29_012172 [Acer saccharum]
MAEILAIKKACELCASNHQLAKRNIQIVSDYTVAVSWANSVENFGSYRHINIIYDIRGYLQQMKNVSVIFSSRSSNSMADSIAKLSSSGAADRVEWGEL